MRKMQLVFEGKGGREKKRISSLCWHPREVFRKRNEGVGVQGLLLYRLPRMLYILLPESRQAASRSLDSTRRRVQSRVVSRYICMCKHVSAATVAPLLLPSPSSFWSLFTLPLLRFTSCYSRAQSIFQVFTAAAGTNGDWETESERERETEKDRLRWAKSKLNTRPPKANTTVRDASVTRTKGGTIYDQLSRKFM